MKKFGVATYAFIFLLPFTILSCSTEKSPARIAAGPVVKKVESVTTSTQPASAKSFDEMQKKENPALANSGSVTPAGNGSISSRVTLQKTGLFQRTFLYSIDVQSASLSFDYTVLAFNHIPFQFRQVNDRLQMIAVQDQLVESTINTTEQKLGEFPIVSQEGDTIVIEVKEASQIVPKAMKQYMTVPAIKSSWLRSTQKTDDGLYVMFESSLEFENDKFMQIMESFFPRDALIPTGAKPIYNDSSLSKFSDRFRVFSSELWTTQNDGKRAKVEILHRFQPVDGKTIDYYILPNVPEAMLPVMKAGVEGWNRYSQKLWSKDLVSFKGTLPSGIKLGDPRYNIIRYDNDSTVSSAWGVSAADPLTGIQSHGLINIPLGRFVGETKSWEKGKGFAQKDIRKSKNAEEIDPNPLDSIISSKTYLDLYMQTTIMHEIGHSLGFSHNFRGSMVKNFKDSSSPNTSTVMDYLDGEDKMQLFEKPGESGGPILEYDRQIISFLYNEAKDLSEKDPIMPVCSDGDLILDPLCVKYDSGGNAVDALQASLNLVKDPDARMGKVRSLQASIADLTLKIDTLNFTSEEEVKKSHKVLLDSLDTILNFYFYSKISSDITSLQGWFYKSSKAIGLEDAEEQRIRLGAIDLYRSLVGVTKFDPKTKDMIDRFQTAILEKVKNVAAVQALSEDQRKALIQKLDSEFIDFFEINERYYLAKIRSLLFSTMVYKADLPFLMITKDNEKVDLEKEFADNLVEAVTSKKLRDGTLRYPFEREYAAESLFSFHDSAIGKPLLQRAIQEIESEIKATTDNKSREQIKSIYKNLFPKKD